MKFKKLVKSEYSTFVPNKNDISIELSNEILDAIFKVAKRHSILKQDSEYNDAKKIFNEALRDTLKEFLELERGFQK